MPEVRKLFVQLLTKTGDTINSSSVSSLFTVRVCWGKDPCGGKYWLYSCWLFYGKHLLKKYFQFMISNPKIRARRRNHFILPPMPPKKPLKKFPRPVVLSLKASPRDWIRFPAASDKLPTVFSSRSPIPFQESFIQTLIAIMMELVPIEAPSNAAPSALPMSSKTLPPLCSS